MRKLNDIKERLLKSSLFKDSFWAILGSAVGKGLALIAGIAVARFLGKEVYGEYGMIKSNLVLISTFSTFGLGYTATKFIAQFLKEENEKVYNIHLISTKITLVFSSILAILIFIFAEPFAKFLEGEHLTSLFRLSAVAIIFNALTTTQIGELAGLGKYKTIAVNNIIVGFFTFATSVLFTYLWDIEGAAISLILSFFFNCIINGFSLKRYITNKTKMSQESYKELTKEVFSFSLPVALQESTYSITHWLTMMVLVKMADFGEIGLSSAANQWFAVLLFIPGALRNVALSYLSSTFDNATANKLMLNRLVFVNFISTFVPFIIVCVFSGFICSWYGDSYNGLQAVLIVCIFNSVINSVSNVYTQELMAHSKNWYLFFTRLGRDLLSLLIGAIAIYYYAHGALMLCLSGVICQALYLLLLRLKVKRI